ncbi:Gfo/Idh/MocA family protein [Paenibacillus allorhizosphaerae]|uniref:Inositol 2-dehydrogenase/D-chiro-inositol 3-dehydrogenase n=1 Tax=Paenibacillus allorhizosphaerae TaxID=2849866 RepID=A0ABM8VB74_9BACL|nr:Gfo/Idh/MocA family oxidoreductase [Paenibacillus allorhizosphaerae]CAG7618771.1 Inositol 2-dehydrogenase/D-chiro-inositol 3-dehydrogenase [Paenibacillus allorhizosphaerae]
MGQKLKLGAIGTGNIFRGVHMRGWKDHPEVELYAVCDIVKEKAETLAEQYNVKHVFEDYRELLAMEEIDIIDISTSNLFHSEIAVAALKAGKHVFCEKPDAVNPEEAQKMADAAKQSGKTLMVMRNNRFRPASQFLKAYIENGHMGEVYTGRCGWIRRRGIPGKGGWFTTKELSGGGPLIDLGVHFIDLTVWLMGNPRPVSVVGATYCKFAGSVVSDSVHSQFGESREDGTFDVEDLATGFIRFDNGATLQIEFSWASNIEEEMNFLELRGSKAGASFKKGELKLFSEIEGVLCDIAPRLPKDIGGHEKHLHHFIDVVKGRAEPINTPDTGVDMIKILSAIYESARTGSEVKL